jgi:hypothetical protein
MRTKHALKNSETGIHRTKVQSKKIGRFRMLAIHTSVPETKTLIATLKVRCG